MFCDDVSYPLIFLIGGYNLQIYKYDYLKNPITFNKNIS